MNVNEINVAILAYLGDAVYELEVRNYLLSKGFFKVNDLQKESIKYVSATSQARILDKLISKNILVENELYLIKRSRNYKPKSKPRYTDIKTYKMATALETLFGSLYLNCDVNRIKQLMKEIFGD